MKRRFAMGAAILVMAFVAGTLIKMLSSKRWALHPLELGAIGVACAITLACVLGKRKS